MINCEENKRKGIIFAIAAYTLWGFAYLFCGVALKTAIPAVMLAARFAIAFTVMTILMIIRKEKISLKGKNIAALILIGLFEPAISFYLESLGIVYTSSSFAGIMVTMNPIVSFFLAMLLLGEKTTLRQRIFIFVATFGVLIATVSGVSGNISLLGVFLLFCSTLSNSASKLINRRISHQFTAFERTYSSMLVSFIAFAVIAAVKCSDNIDLLLVPLRTPSFIISVLGLGILCSTGAFFCYNVALAELPLSKVSSFCGICTIVSIITGAFILHEEITIFSLIGAALIIWSIWNINR